MYLLLGKFCFHLVLGWRGCCRFCTGKSSQTNVTQGASDTPSFGNIILDSDILISQEDTGAFDRFTNLNNGFVVDEIGEPGMVGVVSLELVVVCQESC